MVRSTTRGAGFEQAAIDAVLQWRYEPLTLNDEPVHGWIRVTNSWTLH